MSDPSDSASIFADADTAAEAEPPERLSIALIEEAGDWSDFAPVEPAIERAAAALARHPRCGRAVGAEASVVLASDAVVRRLNSAYRGKDAPTNVLSFPFQTPPGARADDRCLGDVVLAVETIRKEAAEREMPPVHHLQHLVVHGLLHLLGHDHATEAEAQEMERLEAEILAALGVSDPYAPDRA
jgi:probable rRNA maturation factor